MRVRSLSAASAVIAAQVVGGGTAAGHGHGSMDHDDDPHFHSGTFTVNLGHPSNATCEFTAGHSADPVEFANWRVWAGTDQEQTANCPVPFLTWVDLTYYTHDDTEFSTGWRLDNVNIYYLTEDNPGGEPGIHAIKHSRHLANRWGANPVSSPVFTLK